MDRSQNASIALGGNAAVDGSQEPARRGRRRPRSDGGRTACGKNRILVDRAAFWTDLAASMSHEIRNPLVAIKTFAQLLPERFDDADFRKDFNEIVVQEIDRLDKSSPRSTTSPTRPNW